MDGGGCWPGCALIQARSCSFHGPMIRLAFMLRTGGKVQIHSRETWTECL